MNDQTSQLLLQEFRDFRKEFSEWKQDTGERVATLETKVTDLYGNGRDGRVTKIEKKLASHDKLIWIWSGVIFAAKIVWDSRHWILGK